MSGARPQVSLPRLPPEARHRGARVTDHEGELSRGERIRTFDLLNLIQGQHGQQWSFALRRRPMRPHLTPAVRRPGGQRGGQLAAFPCRRTVLPPTSLVLRQRFRTTAAADPPSSTPCSRLPVGGFRAVGRVPPEPAKQAATPTGLIEPLATSTRRSPGGSNYACLPSSCCPFSPLRRLLLSTKRIQLDVSRPVVIS